LATRNYTLYVTMNGCGQF